MGGGRATSESGAHVFARLLAQSVDVGAALLVGDVGPEAQQVVARHHLAEHLAGKDAPVVRRVEPGAVLQFQQLSVLLGRPLQTQLRHVLRRLPPNQIHVPHRIQFNTTTTTTTTTKRLDLTLQILFYKLAKNFVIDG